MSLKEEYCIYVFNEVKSLYSDCLVYRSIRDNSYSIHIDSAENIYDSLRDTCNKLIGSWRLEISPFSIKQIKYFDLINDNLEADVIVWNRAKNLKALLDYE